MSISLVAHSAAGHDPNGATTPAVDTTGANFLALAISDYRLAVEATPTDSYGNTWTSATPQGVGDNRCTLWYCASPVVGPGHTVSLSESSGYPCLAFSAWKGVVAASPLDVQAGASTASGTTLAAGPITPTSDGALILAAIGDTEQGTRTIGGGFVAVDQVDYDPAVYFGAGLAYLVQTTAAAASPAWSWSSTGPAAAAIAAFRAAPDSPAATPTFTPAAGTYATPQSVAIGSTTPGAVIHYTTDGTTPTASSPTYSGPISLTSGDVVTIEALAVAAGHTDSAVASASYTIESPALTPTFSPSPGSYVGAQSVAISCATPGATIHYTLDGSTPTTSSATYSGPIALASSATVKALAVATGYAPSAVASASYAITAPSLAIDSPSHATPGAVGVSVQLKGTGTAWTSTAPTFAASAGTITAQAIASDTAATLTYTAPGSAGPVTITDPSTGAAAELPVYASSAGNARARWFPGLTRRPHSRRP